MRPIHILMLYDVPGWAWWNKILQIEANISGDFILEKTSIGSRFQHEHFDFIVSFAPEASLFLKSVPPKKIILGCTSPLLLGRLVRSMREKKCIGGFVNSLEMYENAEYKENLYCCQNGVNTDLFSPPQKPVKRLTACWVGNSQSIHKKGLGLIRKACKLADVPLNCLDRQPIGQKRELLALDQVRDQIYHRSSFYICASQVDATPNSCLEAMACELPVISTRVGNMLEIIADGYNGFLVDRDVESITKAIEKLKNTNVHDMGKKARSTILDGWTWGKQVRKFEYMFRDLLAKQDNISDITMMTPGKMDYTDYFECASRCLKQGDNKNAEFWFLKVLESKNSPFHLESMANFHLGVLLEAQETPGWQSFLSKYVEMVRGKNDPSVTEIYRCASAYKRLGEFVNAKTWFKKLIDLNPVKNMMGGAFFHLGEMASQENNRVSARQYFELCLEFIPGHRMAAKYLEMD